MTEGSVHDGNHLVLVRAQVMTRDDSSGGWVPVGGGGLSNVVIRKRNVSSDEDAKHEYLVYGKRMLDESVVLSCIIKKDFQYNKVNPTFHHWSTGDKKFGLTFQTAADARAFDKGVRMAVEDVLDGHPESSHMLDADVGDDDVFMAIDLPVERGDSRSSSGSSSNGGGSNSGGVVVTAPTPTAMPLSTTGGDPYPHANHHRMHYIPRPQQQQQQRGSHVANNNSGVGTVDEIWVKHNEKTQALGVKEVKDGDKIEVLQEPYSYVQFAKSRPSVHEYSYPIVEALKMERKEDRHSYLQQQQHMFNQQQGQSGKGSGCVPPSPHAAVARGAQQQPPLLPTKTKRHKEKKREKLKNLLLEQARCKHCHEMFCEEENERGSCEYAPDCLRSCINMVTCISCAQCMLYHCMSDSEGDFAHHPCSCDRSDDNCSRRWLGLTFLSLLVPCLWCYVPLSACHHCGVKCGVWGGRHEAT